MTLSEAIERQQRLYELQRQPVRTGSEQLDEHFAQFAESLRLVLEAARSHLATEVERQHQQLLRPLQQQ